MLLESSRQQVSLMDGPFIRGQSPCPSVIESAYYRHNFAMLLGDAIAFGLAATFASTTTTLPDLVRRLTDNPVAVGLLSAVTSGAWLLPQMLYARFLASRPRKKPFLILGTALGRPAYLLYAAALWLGLGSPRLALLLLFAAQAIFMAGDSLASVAWFDVYAKCIPPNRRGRMIGLAQSIRGVLAIGAGALIALLLSAQGPSFPHNYAAIIGLAGLFLLISFLFLTQIREPAGPAEQERLSWRAYVQSLISTIRRDATFRRLLLVRLLAGCDALALYYYIVFARDGLGLGPETVGIFNTVQTAGGIVASLVLGALSERWGSQRVIQVATALGATAPLLGLALYISGARSSPAIVVAYAWVFFCIGVTLSAGMLGWFNYTLELSPADRRPTYLGIFNTSAGILIALPPLGGWLQERASYGALFAVTAGVLLLAHLLTWRLPARPSPETQPAD